MFTGQHYRKIAQIIWWSSSESRHKYESNLLDKTILINSFCDLFKEDNPEFNEKKFREACRNEQKIAHSEQL